jgi:DnaK suppressor protein
MDKNNLDYFKKRLLDEKKELEGELGGIGKKNGNGEWEATSGNMDVDTADENEVADKFEELEDNTGIVSNLDKQLIDVNAALARIDAGTYGVCETCGKPIEKERLEANPAARVSIKHGH